jgi:hypothetical protein
MRLDNFQDLSVRGSDTRAGFQFEFYCAHCERRWKSPFKPFRMGQFNGMLTQLAEFFQGAQHASYEVARVSEWRGHRAHAQAQQEAQQMAQHHYSVCTVCHKACCEHCFDARELCCQPCLNSTHAGNRSGTASSASSAPCAPAGHGPACPSCSTPNAGGRFCAECGFDMASTHKSCPGCAAMCERATRFCADCGHGF